MYVTTMRNIRYLGMRLFPGYLVTWPATRTMCKYNVQARRKWGGWGGFSPPVFGQTVNPILTRGADYAHHSIMGLVWLKFAVVPLRTLTFKYGVRATFYALERD